MTDYLKLVDEALRIAAGAVAKKPPEICEKTANEEVLSQTTSSSFAGQISENTQISQISLISHPEPLRSSQSYSSPAYTLGKKDNEINDASALLAFIEGHQQPENSLDCEKSEICEITSFASRFQTLCSARPEGVDNQRFLQAIADGEQFLARPCGRI